MGVDEGFGVGPEHGGQPVGALPEVGAAAAVVEHDDPVGDIAVAAIGDRTMVGRLCSVEALHPMGGVTERLVATATAAAQTPRTALAQQVALGIEDHHVAGNPVRAMIRDLDTSRSGPL